MAWSVVGGGGDTSPGMVLRTSDTGNGAASPTGRDIGTDSPINDPKESLDCTEGTEGSGNAEGIGVAEGSAFATDTSSDSVIG